MMARKWRDPHKRGRKSADEAVDIDVCCADCGEIQHFSYVECKKCLKKFCMGCANYIGERQWICFSCLTGKLSKPIDDTPQTVQRIPTRCPEHERMHVIYPLFARHYGPTQYTVLYCEFDEHEIMRLSFDQCRKLPKSEQAKIIKMTRTAPEWRDPDPVDHLQ